MTNKLTIRTNALARKLLPEDRYAQVRRGVRAATRTKLNDELFTAEGARFSELAETFTIASRIGGYFTYDDALVFTTILKMQTAFSIKGDLFEIGTYQGRSAVFLAMCLQTGERLVVCDAFETPTEDTYHDLPTPESLRANLKRVVPEIDLNFVEVIEGLSTKITLTNDPRFRFAPIDWLLLVRNCIFRFEAACRTHGSGRDYRS